jgi:hypothetical protein
VALLDLRSLVEDAGGAPATSATVTMWAGSRITGGASVPATSAAVTVRAAGRVAPVAAKASGSTAAMRATARPRAFTAKGTAVGAYLISTRAAVSHWDPTGSNRLLYSRHIDIGGTLRHMIFTSDPDFSDEVAITQGVAGAPQSHAGNARWFMGPSSTRYILYQAQRDGPTTGGSPGQGYHNDLWIATEDGTTHTRIWQYDTDGSIGSLVPIISDDGLRVAWASMRAIADANAPYGYWRLNTATLSWPAGVPTLSSVANISPVIGDPTPEGKFYETSEFVPGLGAGVYWIAFAANVFAATQAQETMDLYICALDGTGLTRLTGTSGTGAELGRWDEHVRYSPVGARDIAWASNVGDLVGGAGALRLDIWLMASNGATKRQVSFFHVDGHQHQDGSGLGAVPANGWAATPTTWSPDGNSLIVNIVDVAPSDPLTGSGPVVILTGFLAEGTSPPVTLRGQGRLADAGVKGGVGAPAERATGRLAATGAHASTAPAAARLSGRLAAAGIKASVTSATVRALARMQALTQAGATATAALLGRGQLAAVIASSRSAVVALRGAGRLSAASTLASAQTAALRGASRLTATPTKSGAATVTLRASGRLSAVGVKGGVWAPATGGGQATPNDLGHFRRGELVPHLGGTSATTGLEHFRLGEPYPAAIAGAPVEALSSPARLASTGVRGSIQSVIARAVAALAAASAAAPPSSTATAAARLVGRLAAAAIHAGTHTVALLGRGRLAAATAKSGTSTAAIRARGQLAAAVTSARSATVALRGVSRLGASTTPAYTQPAGLRGVPRFSVTVVRASATTVSVRGTGRAASVGVRASTGQAVVTARGRMALAGARGGISSAVLRSLGRLADGGTAQRLGAVSLRGVGRGAAVFGVVIIPTRASASDAGYGAATASDVAHSEATAGELVLVGSATGSDSEG